MIDIFDIFAFVVFGLLLAVAVVIVVTLSTAERGTAEEEARQRQELTAVNRCALP
jgi:hypothetical protein